MERRELKNDVIWVRMPVGLGMLLFPGFGLFSPTFEFKHYRVLQCVMLALQIG